MAVTAINSPIRKWTLKTFIWLTEWKRYWKEINCVTFFINLLCKSTSYFFDNRKCKTIYFQLENKDISISFTQAQTVKVD